MSFVIMEEQFKAEQVNDIKEKKPNLAATQLRGMKLGTFLDIVLLSMNATYIVRPDYVEITTFSRRLEEKVTRVFPVADLVIPIPSSVNQQTLQQNLQFQQSQLAIFGQVIGAANFFGNGGGRGQASAALVARAVAWEPSSRTWARTGCRSSRTRASVRVVLVSVVVSLASSVTLVASSASRVATRADCC